LSVTLVAEDGGLLIEADAMAAHISTYV